MDCLAAALAALRCGSFSAAAIELGVTHAAVSRRVASAETWAGAKLFERHGRGVRPTLHGQRLLTRLSQTFEQIEAMADRTRRPRARPLVRLSVTPSFARFWLLPRIAELEKSDLRIEVTAEQYNADLQNGEADLAVRYGRGGWKTGRETPLFEETLVPVAAPVIVAERDRVSAKTLATLPRLHSSESTNWRAWSAQHGVEFRHHSKDRTLSDYGLTLEAACAGLGVALWNTGLHQLGDLKQRLTVLTRLSSKSALRFFLLEPSPARSDAAMRLSERIRDQ
jgi:LysR family transcriptional regulator, glycine cleavage system transcriptional activator